MRISKILEDCGALSVKGDSGRDILSITADSRKVSAGCMFIAVKGFATDGHIFIDKALEAGASAIVYDNAQDAEPWSEKYPEAAFIRVESSRHALGIIASNFYGRPSEKLTLVGITGTNGKTTTVTLLYRMFTRLGYNCGLLSTIANYVGERMSEAVNTTSDPITINSLMAEMVDAGCAF